MRANGRSVTLSDGRKLFVGSSGTGAPYELELTSPPHNPVTWLAVRVSLCLPVVGDSLRGIADEQSSIFGG